MEIFVDKKWRSNFLPNCLSRYGKKFSQGSVSTVQQWIPDHLLLSHGKFDQQNSCESWQQKVESVICLARSVFATNFERGISCDNSQGQKDTYDFPPDNPVPNVCKIPQGRPGSPHFLSPQTMDTWQLFLRIARTGTKAYSERLSLWHPAVLYKLKSFQDKNMNQSFSKNCLVLYIT